MNRRRLALSVAVACLLVAIPATPVGLMGYTQYRPSLLLVLLLIKWRLAYLLAPGFIVSTFSAPLEPFFLHHPGALLVIPLLSVLVSAPSGQPSSTPCSHSSPTFTRAATDLRAETRDIPAWGNAAGPLMLHALISILFWTTILYVLLSTSSSPHTPTSARTATPPGLRARHIKA